MEILNLKYEMYVIEGIKMTLIKIKKYSIIVPN